MNKIKNIIMVLGIMTGVGLLAMPANVGALDVFQNCTDASLKNTEICKAKNTDTVGGFLKILTNALLFILGSIAVVVIIIAGITYSMSAGDPALVTKAKNTIIYAIVGLVTAILAYAIVNFVITQF